MKLPQFIASRLITEKIALITLSNESKRNALNLKMLQELHTSLNAFSNNPSVACIILNGAGADFSVGMDLEELSGKPPLFHIEETFKSIAKPIIASVNGYALGGGFELALLCDVMYASDDAKFAFPEVRHSIIPGFGGCRLLSEAVGKRKAMEMIWTGRTVTAMEALQLGIACKIAKGKDVLWNETLKFAMLCSRFSSTAIISTKEAILNYENMPIQQAKERERELFNELYCKATDT